VVFIDLDFGCLKIKTIQWYPKQWGKLVGKRGRITLLKIVEFLLEIESIDQP
jgi:hypothetical protein